jgi:emopamil binding protein
MQTIPLSGRRFDIAFIAFFVINLGFITYCFDIEQLTIADPRHFTYPLWPPRAIVDLVHWWGRNFDPPLMAREAWWRATIWIDVLGFGPFYGAAIYAFVKRRDWIRLPAIIWSSVMLTNVTIILFEEFAGAHATSRPGVIVAANLAWLLFPVAMIARMRGERPFAR